MENNKKLYNVLFPIWLLLLFPITWLIVIPGNFIIDSLVLIISMNILKIDNKKEFYKKKIIKIFIFGMISDIIGTIYLFIMQFIFEIGIRGDEIYLTLPGMIISTIMIFIFNYYVTFKNIDKKERFKLSIIFAIVTAPYTFLIPTNWIY